MAKNSVTMECTRDCGTLWKKGRVYSITLCDGFTNRFKMVDNSTNKTNAYLTGTSLEDLFVLQEYFKPADKNSVKNTPKIISLTI